MSYATGIVSSHFMNHSAQLFYGLIVIVSTVANWFLHKVIDKPNIDQKELQYLQRAPFEVFFLYFHTKLWQLT